jgi:hypothetical protein
VEFSGQRSTAAIATTVAAFCILTACSSEKAALPTTEPSAPLTTTTAPDKCVRPHSDRLDPDEKYLTAEIDRLQLPVGTCLFSVDASDRWEKPGEVWITVNLTVPASTGPDDLRPVATDIAHVLKRTEIAQRTSVVDVTNWGFAKPKYTALLSDENFQAHPWDGTPSREAEMATWTIITPPK